MSMRFPIDLRLLPLFTLLIAMTDLARAQESVVHAPDCVRLGVDWWEDGYWAGGRPGVEWRYESRGG